MDDTRIIELYFARSEQAIEETANKYGTYLKVIADNILHSTEDTEEVVSDVYFAAWNTMPPQSPNVLKHYLSRITRNLSFKRYSYLSARKRCAETELLLSELDECIPDNCRSAEEIVEAKELGAVINRFLGALSQEEIGLFVSRFYYAMNTSQLAGNFDCSERQIKYRLQKLRKKLCSYLQKEGIHL